MTYNEFEESFAARSYFRLTKMQWKIFALVVFRDQASYSAIMQSFWPDANNEPVNATNSIKVQMSIVRKKLKPFNIKIGTAWGDGYYMSTKEKERVIEMTRKAMNQ